MTRSSALVVLLLASCASTTPVPQPTAPVGQGRFNGAVALRLPWLGLDAEAWRSDEQGRLRLVATAEARPAGGGWLYVPSGYNSDLHVRWRGTPLVPVSPRSVQGVSGLLIGPRSPALEDALTEGLLACCSNRSEPRRLAVVESFDDVPPRCGALAHLRHIVVDLPGASPALQQALAAWAMDGGTLVLTPRATAGLDAGDALRRHLPRLADQGRADMVWGRLSRGYVVQLSRPAPGSAAFWHRVALSTNLGEAPARVSDRPYQVEHISPLLDPTEPTPGWALAAYLLAYLAALVAMRRRLGWWDPAVVSVLWLGLALGLVRALGRGQVEAFQATCLVASSGESVGTEMTEVTIGSPGWATFTLRLPDQAGADSAVLLRTLADDAVALDGWRIRANGRATQVLSRPVALGGGVGVEVQWTGARFVGRVTNGLSTTLRAARLIRGDRFVDLGNLAPGAERRVNDLPVEVWLEKQGRWPRSADAHIPVAASPLMNGHVPWLGSSSNSPLLLAWLDPPEALSMRPVPARHTRVRLLAAYGPAGRRTEEDRLATPGGTYRVTDPGAGRSWRVRPFRVGPADTVRFADVAPSTHVWLPREQRWLPIRGLRELPAARALNEGVVLVGWPGTRGEAGDLKVRGSIAESR